MHPYIHAKNAPQHPAYIMVETGEVVTYEQLDQRSNQAAQLFRAAGLQRGDCIVIFLENHARFLELCWAAQRSGLYYTPISSRLTESEIDYIVADAKPKMFFTSSKLLSTASNVTQLKADRISCYVVDGEGEGFQSYEQARDSYPAEPISDQSCGIDMLYSSGTTGRPKGVKLPLPEGPIETLAERWKNYHTIMGFDFDSVHYIPSPLYHALPIHHAMVAQNYGGTVLIIDKFDPETALKVIEKYGVTQSSWVPTMFIRLLKLSEEIRKSYDVSSMQAMVHGAAPCPISVKEKIIEWFGPVVYEAYASTEGFGSTSITSEEWLKHKGSVGKPILGPVHIVDEVTGESLPAGKVGAIYFENPRKVEYLNDTEKTDSVKLKNGWATAGDIGYLDKDGYLYLTDRKSNMIISGGVNIYPQETENLLITHPKVFDVAVFGVPNEDFGEEVKAVVQPMDKDAGGPELERELIDFCLNNLSDLKAPRSIDFRASLPRHETGKLYKRLLRDEYWADHNRKI
ncbi:acyl-CoA synthetase [Pseudomaricurvus alkylphenolicus]|uniref:acyl-CoA synthetase n=1 Tax=Pseudomaricurvus alkylphenolicus TaxID=1306991 RepID=UPI00142033CE|nr:acyl-CoA synthetase [Pseudomaricurvus alkylphenolicus]NIB41466.1 acyl-CoA synthetase [Pseudomaricurvus alkylphenolicus]